MVALSHDGRLPARGPCPHPHHPFNRRVSTAFPTGQPAPAVEPAQAVPSLLCIPGPLLAPAPPCVPAQSCTPGQPFAPVPYTRAPYTQALTCIPALPYALDALEPAYTLPPLCPPATGQSVQDHLTISSPWAPLQPL